MASTRSPSSVSLICGIKKRRRIFCALGSAIRISPSQIPIARRQSGFRHAKSGRKRPNLASICPSFELSASKKASFRFRRMPRKMLQFKELGHRIPGSSTVEHSAVNRRVASSNLARGANLVFLQRLKVLASVNLGRFALGRKPKALCSNSDGRAGPSFLNSAKYAAFGSESSGHSLSAMGGSNSIGSSGHVWIGGADRHSERALIPRAKCLPDIRQSAISFCRPPLADCRPGLCTRRRPLFLLECSWTPQRSNSK